MLDFKPPKENRVVIGSVKLMLPLLMRLSQRVQGVEMDRASLDRLKSTDEFPTILVPNHPNRADPHVMFAVSNRVGKPFRFMCARETFDRKLAGLKCRGFFMTRLGSYSVVRGAVDRDSFRMTRDMLAKGSHKLVIFGEGEISHQNETIMPFESGVAQFGFWALHDMERADNIKPLYLLPVGLKYVYKKDMWIEIEQAITNLELNVLPEGAEPPTDLYDRVKNIGGSLLGSLAREYHLRLSEGSSLNERINRMREHILSQMESFMENSCLNRTGIRSDGFVPFRTE